MGRDADVVIDCDSHVMEPADLWERYRSASGQPPSGAQRDSEDE